MSSIFKLQEALKKSLKLDDKKKPSEEEEKEAKLKALQAIKVKKVK